MKRHPSKKTAPPKYALLRHSIGRAVGNAGWKTPEAQKFRKMVRDLVSNSDPRMRALGTLLIEDDWTPAEWQNVIRMALPTGPGRRAAAEFDDTTLLAEMLLLVDEGMKPREAARSVALKAERRGTLDSVVARLERGLRKIRK